MCPNSSLSRICSLSAAQLSATNGRFFRGLFWWIALATSSLPVPVSPWIRTVASVGRNTLQLRDHVLHLRTIADNTFEAKSLIEPPMQLGIRPSQVWLRAAFSTTAPQLLKSSGLSR